MKRRDLLQSLAASGLLVGWPQLGRARSFPTKNLTIVVPYAPGATDQLARALASSMGKTLGKSVLVETRPGAGGTVGAAYVAKTAPADGHTMLFSVSAVQTIAPHQNQLPYGFDDLMPVARVTVGPNVLAARADAPFKDLKGLIAHAQANPEAVTFGSAGTGSTTHITGEAIARAARIKLTHIPFQGVAPAVAAAVGGNIDLVIGFAQAIEPHVQAGKLAAIAQLGPKRARIVPGIPTLKEGGVDLQLVPNLGFWVAKGTPPEAIQAIEQATEKASTVPEFQNLAKKMVTEIDFAGSAAFRRELEEENKFYKGLLPQLGLGR